MYAAISCATCARDSPVVRCRQVHSKPRSARLPSFQYENRRRVRPTGAYASVRDSGVASRNSRTSAKRVRRQIELQDHPPMIRGSPPEPRSGLYVGNSAVQSDSWLGSGSAFRSCDLPPRVSGEVPCRSLAKLRHGRP